MTTRSLFGAFAAIALLAIASGCATNSSSEKSATPVATAETDNSSLGQAREAGRIVVAIQKSPDRVTEILTEHGTTADAFEQLLFKIAQDPGLTDAYEAARTGAAAS
jgi:hypothetical protein